MAVRADGVALLATEVELVQAAARAAPPSSRRTTSSMREICRRCNECRLDKHLLLERVAGIEELARTAGVDDLVEPRLEHVRLVGRECLGGKEHTWLRAVGTGDGGTCVLGGAKVDRLGLVGRLGLLGRLLGRLVRRQVRVGGGHRLELVVRRKVVLAARRAMHREGHHSRTRLEPLKGRPRHAQRLALELAVGLAALADDEEVLVPLEDVRRQVLAEVRAASDRRLRRHVRLPLG
eukprot:7376098-Prymnesium_polylepis.1